MAGSAVAPVENGPLTSSLTAVFRDIAIYGMGYIALRGLGLLTLPIYTRTFAPAEFGTLNLVLTAISMLQGVLILGGDTAYVRFYFEATTDEEQRVVTFTWLGFLGLWASLVVFVALPWSGYLSEWLLDTRAHTLLFAVGLLSGLVAMMQQMLAQVLRIQFRAVLVSVANLITAALAVGIGLVAVFALDWGLVGVVAGTVGGTVLGLPMLVWLARDLLRPRFSFGILRRMLAYGVPLVPVTLAYWVFASSDRIMLGRLASLEELGLYAVGATIVSVLLLVFQALGQAWTPHAVRLYETDPAGAALLYSRFLTYILGIFGLLAVALTALAPELIQLLASSRYLGATTVIGPLAIGAVAYASTQVTVSGISLLKRTHYLAIYAGMAAVLNVVLNLIFIPIWGMLAAAWTTCVCYVFLTLAYALTSQRLFRIPYEFRRVIPLIVLTVLFVLGSLAQPSMSWYWALPLKAGYVAIFAAIVLVYPGLTQDEWRKLRGMAHAVMGAFAGQAADQPR